MEPLVSPAVERYCEEHTEDLTPLLQALVRETYAQMHGPQMLVGRVEGQLLKLLVRLVGARRVLEIGMFTGFSALMMAEALPDDGELVTCEVNPKAEAMARRYFAQSPHGSKITVRMGPALHTLETLEPPFDLVFIDADKESYPAYYEAAVWLLRSGGLVVADNVLWSGEVLDPQASDPETAALREFNEKAQADPRVEKVMLPVRDGVLLARKR